MERSGVTSAAGVFTTDLFSLFQSNCGACHVDNSLGGFQVSLLTFPTHVSAKALERITSDDPEVYMPPGGAGGKAFSGRSADDPVVELATLLEAWLAAGRPLDVFYPSSGDSQGSASPYLLSRQVGMQMTNLGNCIPQTDMVGRDRDEGAELDAMFERATELPERLEQTDLTSLDSEVLARKRRDRLRARRTRCGRTMRRRSAWCAYRVGNLDRVRRSDADLRHPANTRFYKTFLKRVIDIRGNETLSQDGDTR